MLKAVVALVIEDTHLISLWEYYWLNEHVALMQYQMYIFASCVFSCISPATFLVSPMVVNFPMYFGGFSSKLGGIFTAGRCIFRVSCSPPAVYFPLRMRKREASTSSGRAQTAQIAHSTHSTQHKQRT